MTHRSAPDVNVRPERNRSRLKKGQTLDRVTFRATDEQLEAIQTLVDADVYHSRSEAIRAGIQQLLERHARVDLDVSGDHEQH